MNQLFRRHPAIGMLSLLVGLWGIWSLVDVSGQATAGFQTDGNSLVISVDEDSPAARAGLSAGDRITGVNGIANSDTAGLARLGRAAAGEVRRLEISRAGQSLQIDITYRTLSPAEQRRSLAISLLGFGFLVIPVRGLLRTPGRASQVLAVMGLGLALALFGEPAIEPVALRAVLGTLRNAFVLVGIVGVLHFLLVFHRPRPWVQGAAGARWLYLPAVVFWVLISYRIVVQPPASPLMNTLTNVAGGVLLSAYLLLSIMTLLRAWIREPRATRRTSGLHLLLLGAAGGLLPMMLASVVEKLGGGYSMPGSDFYFLSLVLVPLAWTRACEQMAK